MAKGKQPYFLGSRKIGASYVFLQQFNAYCYPQDEMADEIRTIANNLKEKKYTIKDTTATYRTINHWSSIGLFEDVRPDDKSGWRKFSIIDLTWIKILEELRKFGFSLNKMKNGYKSLFKCETYLDPKQQERLLEYAIFLCMKGTPIYLIVFSDGHIDLASKDDLIFYELTGQLWCNNFSYLLLSLNHCLQLQFPEMNFMGSLNEQFYTLSEEEVVMLSTLRSGKYDEVRVSLGNGEVQRIDTKTKHFGEIGKLADILNKIPNGDFSIKKQHGKIVYVEAVKKQKTLKG